MARLVPLCGEHAIRLVVVWPGEVAPSGLDRREDLFEVVRVAPATVHTAARRAGAARAQADLIMFTDDEQAIEPGWAEVVTLRVGLIRRGSHRGIEDNWASILREQGLTDNADGS